MLKNKLNICKEKIQMKFHQVKNLKELYIFIDGVMFFQFGGNELRLKNEILSKHFYSNTEMNLVQKVYNDGFKLLQLNLTLVKRNDLGYKLWELRKRDMSKGYDYQRFKDNLYQLDDNGTIIDNVLNQLKLS